MPRGSAPLLFQQEHGQQSSTLQEPSDEEPPGEGLDHHEVMGDGDQSVLEPEGPFSASPENASLVASTNSSTLPELIRSEREEETSRNAVLSENVTSSTGTGNEVVKLLDVTALKGFFSI